MENAMIINNLTIKYGEHKVIDNLSCAVKSGMTTAIMGTSGAGKTSFINAIMGLIPYEGTIEAAPSTIINAVFQEDRLCEGLSVMRNLRMVSKLTPEEINACLDEIGMSGTAHKKIFRLSGGMKRRVAILRGLISDGNFIIMDEPFKGLDSVTKEAVMAFTKKKASERTMLLITHDPTEALYFNSEILTI